MNQKANETADVTVASSLADSRFSTPLRESTDLPASRADVFLALPQAIAGECDNRSRPGGSVMPETSTAAVELPVAHSAVGGLTDAYVPIQHELSQVEALLESVFTHEHPYIDALLKHGSQFAGKRIRPALLLLAAKACGVVRNEHVVLAAAIEMIHMASLVHDDVLDESDTRRHVETVHRKWNHESSVLFGDYLFTQAFCIVGERVGGKACGFVAGVTNRVCEGELRQIASRGQFDLKENEYYRIIEAKTAVLCQSATQLGASFAIPEGLDLKEAQLRVDALSEYGRLLGLAFQIIDDVLDLEGDETYTGKSMGRDLEMSKATLPLIRAMQQAPSAERLTMLERLAQRQIESSDVRDWVDRHGGIESARQEARSLALKSAELVEQVVGNTKPGQVLAQLSRFVIERHF